MRHLNYYTDRDRNDRLLAFLLDGKPVGASDAEYAVFLAHYADGKSYREIAAERGLGYDKVRQMAYRVEAWGAAAFDRVRCPCCDGRGFVEDAEP